MPCPWYPGGPLGRAYELRATGGKALCLTLTIGVLVVQVFGGPGAGDHRFHEVTRTGTNFVAIYPPQLQTAAWPPAVLLDDTSLITFANPLAPLTDGSSRA